jgi:single-strand DNA-binding protein
MDFNKVILVGRATANPELRTTPGGQSVTTLGIATNRVWTDKSGAKQEATEFTNVVMWGRTAEVASQYLVKGATVLVEGRLQTRSWEDKQGQPRKTTEVLCERMQLGPRPLGQGGAPLTGAGQTAGPFTPKFQPARPDGIQNSNNGSGVPAPASTVQKPADEELPVINFEEEGDIKPEDIPF